MNNAAVGAVFVPLGLRWRIENGHLHVFESDRCFFKSLSKRLVKDARIRAGCDKSAVR